MRFRGVIKDGQQIQSLIKILQSFSKYSETFLFRLSENELQLVNDLPQTSSQFVVNCVLKCDDYFEEYSFRGIASDSDLICFRLRSESLSQVLSSLLPYIKAFKLRLSKSSVGSANDCVLSLAVIYPTHSDSDRTVCHQIKIDIIRSEEWNDICRQDFTSFDISLHLPDSRILIPTTERLSEFCHYIDIKSKRVDNNKAFLIISVETDSIDVKTKFNDLDLNTDEDIETNDNSDQLVAIRIDIRKLNLLFNALKQLKPTSIVSNISDKNRICFKFFYNSVNFKAFFPNIEI